jgi:hypothetical protein
MGPKQGLDLLPQGRVAGTGLFHVGLALGGIGDAEGGEKNGAFGHGRSPGA